MEVDNDSHLTIGQKGKSPVDHLGSRKTMVNANSYVGMIQDQNSFNDQSKQLPPENVYFDDYNSLMSPHGKDQEDNGQNATFNIPDNILSNRSHLTGSVLKAHET